MKNEWIKLGERGLQIYPSHTWSMSKNQNLHGYPQGMCGLNGFSEIVFIMHPLGCNRDRCLEVTIQEFTSFGYFATVFSLIEELDFRLMVVNWKR